MSWWRIFEQWELLTTVGTLLGPLLTVASVAFVLVTKRNPTSAVAWCLFIFFLPLIGPFFFFLFGYQHVYRPLSRKRRHKKFFQRKHFPARPDTTSGPPEPQGTAVDTSGVASASWQDLHNLAQRLGAFPAMSGNHMALYHHGEPAFDAMLEAIRSARHHIHLETFIFQPDDLGRVFLDALAQKAREGVEVRLLYDAMGSHRLHRNLLQPLRAAGGKCCFFLPLNPFRRRIQVNMRNHRKILVIDGEVGFIGGLNIGDEYLSKSRRFGFWRDTHLKLEGPAVAGLQRVFAEDWDFAAVEDLQDRRYFPVPVARGPLRVQVVESGPDREQKAIREIYFAAILRARQRVWIASPYFVPDEGLLDAIRLAGYLGVDVRLLGLFHPDKWIPFFAGRYYWKDVLDAGVKVYQYTKGMMHSKVILVDGEWASIGTANLDIRSLHLNFEVNCLVHSADVVAELEEAFRHDLTTAIRLDRHVFSRRPFAGRLLDNACRLLSPVL
jgi:cardiolipin synthase